MIAATQNQQRSGRNPILEAHHVTKGEFARLAWDLGKQGIIAVENAKPRERTMRDAHILVVRL
jgi:hypothetical protein